MPELTPFVAMTRGASKHLEVNPVLQRALADGIFKDVWGSTYTGFMGIDSGGDGSSGEILDNPQGRNTAFAIDVSIYRCVDIRGASLASVPLRVYDSLDPDTRKEVQHEALGVLQQGNPYNWVVGPDLLRYSLGSRDLHGNFAWSLVYDTGGRLRGPVPREVYWLPPAQYKPLSGMDLNPKQPKVPFAGLKVRQNNKDVFWPAQNVVYAPTFSPTGDLRGTSKITALRMDLNLRVAGQNSNWWFFQNNQRPDLVITGAFSPTAENVNLMRRIWRAAFGGDNARGPAFLPQDMKVQLLTMASKDAEWLGQRQAAREDILAAFGVPPPVYGDLSRATYENIRTAYQHFWQEGMIPDMDQLAATLTMQFLWRWPDAQRNKLVFGFDYSQIEALQEDANAIWERAGALMGQLNAAIERRWVLPNQARVLGQSLMKMVGLPDTPFAGKVPGGDMFYVRLQEIPIIEASVQASIDTNAARAAVTGGETNKPGNGSWVLPDASQITARRPPDQTPTSPNGTSPAAPQPSQRALPPPAARDWMTRRLKRHLQEQQTAALRAVRAAQLMPRAIDLWDADASRQNVLEILRATAGMAGVDVRAAELERAADTIEEATMLAVAHALNPQDDQQEWARKVRDVFRVAIEQRAALAAEEFAA